MLRLRSPTLSLLSGRPKGVRWSDLDKGGSGILTCNPQEGPTLTSPGQGLSLNLKAFPSPDLRDRVTSTRQSQMHRGMLASPPSFYKRGNQGLERLPG